MNVSSVRGNEKRTLRCFEDTSYILYRTRTKGEDKMCGSLCEHKRGEHTRRGYSEVKSITRVGANRFDLEKYHNIPGGSTDRMPSGRG